MTEMERLRDQVERAFDGDPWCGPSLMSVLADVSWEQASARVPGLARSIGEIVLHLSAWQGAVARRIAGEPVALLEEEGWPHALADGDRGWRDSLRALGESHRLLLGAFDSLDGSALDGKLGDGRDQAMGSGMTAYANLHGIAQHSMYHAGQIALLKKLAALG